ncbi:SAM-dependent methyltransferase HcgC family protein [Methanocaldococcus sp.]
MKHGITNKILTIETKTKVIDVIQSIAEKKFNAIKRFLEGEEFKEALIFGVYLWGNFVAQNLSKYCENIYLVDIHEFMKEFVNTNAKFLSLNDLKLKLIKNEINPDLIIDLTGLGGVEAEFLAKFSPKVAVIEDPKGVFDVDIYELDDSDEKALKLLNKVEKIGLLRTYRKAKVSKTSGTMTLTIDTIVDASKDIIALDGVLYAIPNLRYYEGILFHDKDVYKFLDEISKPAITISSITDVSEKAERILNKNVDLIYSFVDEVYKP